MNEELNSSGEFAAASDAGESPSGENNDESTGRRGRRPKLDDLVHQLIIDAVAAGASLEHAAAAAGVGHATLFEWLAIGRRAEANATNDREMRCVRLLEAIRRAQGESTVAARRVLLQAARAHMTKKTITIRQQLVDRYGPILDEMGDPQWVETKREEVTESPNISAAIALLRHRGPDVPVDDAWLPPVFETDREKYRRIHGPDPKT